MTATALEPHIQICFWTHMETFIEYASACSLQIQMNIKFIFMTALISFIISSYFMQLLM